MDWKIFFATFVTIFVAELGDKTQFAALAASAQTKSTLSVLLAVVLSLGLAGTIGVLAGRFLGDLVDMYYLKLLSGCLFIGLGIYVLYTLRSAT